jgi:hypothetical protein
MKKQTVNSIGIKSNLKPNVETKLPRMALQAALALVAASGLVLLVGCAGHTRKPELSGFLSHYCLVDKVDDTTWRYIDSSRLATYNKFQITDVVMLADYFDGKRLSDETKQKVVDYLRYGVGKAIDSRYPVVKTPGPDVANIRLAITQAYMTENHLGLTVEGEIVDSNTGYQVAALVKTQLSEPYFGGYWDAPSAKEMMDGWASRVRNAIDAAHDAALRH